MTYGVEENTVNTGRYVVLVFKPSIMITYFNPTSVNQFKVATCTQRRECLVVGWLLVESGLGVACCRNIKNACRIVSFLVCFESNR